MNNWKQKTKQLTNKYLTHKSQGFPVHLKKYMYGKVIAVIFSNVTVSGSKINEYVQLIIIIIILCYIYIIII